VGDSEDEKPIRAGGNENLSSQGGIGYGGKVCVRAGANSFSSSVSNRRNYIINVIWEMPMA
jgi:hypothetical protein